MDIREGLGNMIVKYANGKPRRSTTFPYEFDGFHSSEKFLAIELSGSFDCVFGIPWFARHQTGIDRLTGTESQDVSDVVEHEFPRPDEQRFSGDDDNVVKHGFPRLDEQWLSPDEDDDDVV
ncbi:hypothetical protein PR003_g652 [Phytophthora rubi]|uniref:Uncharacterized protein n=1 Tax=Phytophthora rubi TaxID=129364 RepID=A0A6A4G2L4_9STRA|nr:hypothetical protein PR003_g652 [Phytophthora rubi]